MTGQISRRVLLTAGKAGTPVMRPPQARQEAEFLTRCDGSAACVDACPQSILRIEQDAPRMDFSLGPRRMYVLW